MAKGRKTKWRTRFRQRVRRHRDKRIPIVPVIAVASTFFTPCPSGRNIADDIMKGDLGGVMYDAREKFVGIDNAGKFRPEWLVGTYLPIVAAVLVSKFAGKFVNPSIAKIPFVGKYIKL